MAPNRVPPRRPSPAPRSFLGCLRLFLTPQLFKDARHAAPGYAATRWKVHPLLFVLLLMTWCAGESTEERFETARAFYVASYRGRRQPGKSAAGFLKALTRLPAAALRRAAAALRRRLACVFADRLAVDGFVPIGCDGTRLNGPRTPELERRLCAGGQRFDVPTVFVSALVHLPTGLLWAWRLGGPRASEPRHLTLLLAALPAAALLVADAGYVGFLLLQALSAARQQFLIRLSAKAPLYTANGRSRGRPREGLAYYWPQWAQRDGLPPVEVRLIRLRGKAVTGRGKKVDVWLMTNVLDARRLPRARAGRFYRWRWRNEGLFRSYKRTLGKVKLMGRTVAQVHREAEGSLLAVQLLLAQGVLAQPAARRGAVPSVRHVLRVIRTEIHAVAGSYLQRRQPSYRARLDSARVDRRRHRRNQVRRRWPARANPQGPKPPKVQRLGTDLKDLLDTVLGTE